MERQEIDSGVAAPAPNADASPAASPAAAAPAAPRFQKIFSYRECLKNHSVEKGAQSLDGCGQFLAQPDDPLKCSVCTCHRNFHRLETRYSDGSEQCVDRVADEAAAVITDYLSKEKKSGDTAVALLEEIVRLLGLVKQVPRSEKIDLEMVPGQQSPPSPIAEGPPGLTNDEAMEVTPIAASSLSDQAPGSKDKTGKRKRTKFTEQQKVMLEALAEKANWVLANLTKEEQEKGAADIGIKLDSLRYWFHNTKQKKHRKT